MINALMINGSMNKVPNVSVGDFFINTRTDTVHKCIDIEFMDFKWNYAYFDEWLDQKQWVVARFVQPYTLIDVLMG